MTKFEIVDFKKYQEEIDRLTKQLEALKAKMKLEFPLPNGGTDCIDGIQFGCIAKSRSGFNVELMVADYGILNASKYKYETAYLSTFVKIGSGALK